MARSDNLRADLERIRSMPDDEFQAQWGDWCRRNDRDPALMRQRWISDLEHALPHAVAEEAAVVELIAAKDAHRASPTPLTRERKDAAVAAVQAIRAEERADRKTRPLVAGDAFVMGG